MCALNCALWNDKQLDELADLMQTADHSGVASFLAKNFLAMEPNPSTYSNTQDLTITPQRLYIPLKTSTGRIMDDQSDTNLRPLKVGVHTTTTMVTIQPGVFIYGGKVGQIDTQATVNILDPAGAGTFGRGKAADSLARYSIIEVRATDYPHTSQFRWFVDDSVDPNTYNQHSTNTLINKAYPDIVVKHGTPGATPSVPATDSGYWCIAEILIPANATALTSSYVYDTVTDSRVSAEKPNPANWTDTSYPPAQQTRIGRLEFAMGLFGIDHYTTGSVDYAGHHRLGAWHIGTETVSVEAGQINWLNPSSPAHPSYSKINYTNLKTLVDGSFADSLHIHSGFSGYVYPFYTNHKASGHHLEGFHIGDSGGKTGIGDTDLATVTASNLNTLNAGSESDAQFLHTHKDLRNMTAYNGDANGINTKRLLGSDSTAVYQKVLSVTLPRPLPSTGATLKLTWHVMYCTVTQGSGTWPAPVWRITGDVADTLVVSGYGITFNNLRFLPSYTNRYSIEDSSWQIDNITGFALCWLSSGQPTFNFDIKVVANTPSAYIDLEKVMFIAEIVRQ